MEPTFPGKSEANELNLIFQVGIGIYFKYSFVHSFIPASFVIGVWFSDPWNSE